MTAKPAKTTTTTKRKPKPKIEVTHTLVCNQDDVLGLTENEVISFINELKQLCKNKTKQELLQFIIDKVNDDRKWRAWVITMLYRRLTA